MRFTQATLLTLSSGALLVSAAPWRERRAITAEVDVLSCGGLTVKPGKTHNCPQGWVLSVHTANLCVEIGEETTTTRKSSSSHKTTTTRKSTTSTHKIATTTKTKATNQASVKKSTTSSKKSASTHKSSSTNKSIKPATIKPASSTHKSTSSHKSSASAKPTNKSTTKACGSGKRYDAVLKVCVEVNVPGVASVGAGVDVGKGGVDGSVTVDIPGLANIAGGVKLGHGSSTKPSGPSSSSPSGCSDHDALLKLCVKVGNLASVDASVAGKDGLVSADAHVVGVPVKAAVLSSNAVVDAHVGGSLLDATVGGRDTLITASVGDVVKVTSGGSATTGKVVRCPKGQLLHLGICLDVDVHLLGLNLDTAVILAL